VSDDRGALHERPRLEQCHAYACASSRANTVTRKQVPYVVHARDGERIAQIEQLGRSVSAIGWLEFTQVFRWLRATGNFAGRSRSGTTYGVSRCVAMSLPGVPIRF
jgi:hypothetical protein